jgi:hypothetical protein
MLPTRYIFAYIQPYIDDRPFLEKGRSRKSKPDYRVKVINIHKFLSRFVEKPKRELQNNITNRVDSESFFRISIAENGKSNQS